MTQPLTRFECAPPTRSGGATATPDVAASALAALLDVVPQSLLLVDAGARLRYANRAGADLLRRGDLLRVRDHRVAPAISAEMPALQRAIATVASAHGDRRAVLTVHRASERSPIALLLWHLAAPGGALVALFASDGTRAGAIDAPLLRRLYGLTAAEARVAALIAMGHTIAEIAAHLRIGRSTARTHLQRALAKTGAPRQVALARLVFSSPAHLHVLGGLCDER